MRKMVLLLAILGFISSACQYAYAARTLIECGGDLGLAWAEGTLARQEGMESDQRAADAALQSSTYLELETPYDLVWLRQEIQPYVSRAKARYLEQMAQTAPVCLRRMQELTAEAFYLDWKIYEALEHGDTDLAAERQDQWLAAMEGASREYDRLVEKYHWEK